MRDVTYGFACKRCATKVAAALPRDTQDKAAAAGLCPDCGGQLRRLWNANFHLPYGDTDFASVAGSVWKKPLSYEDAFGVEGERGDVAWSPDTYTDAEVEVHKHFGGAS